MDNPMKRALFTFGILALLGGCGPAQTPVPMPIQAEPRVGREMQKTEEEKMLDLLHEKLLTGNDAQFEAQRAALRNLRKNNGPNLSAWPSCAALRDAYADNIEASDTLIGIQEALMAAKVDDHVLCDTPSIWPAAEAAALASVAKFEIGIPNEVAVKGMMNNPARPGMAQCWLDALRSARQQDDPYDQAYASAAQACENSAAPNQSS